MPAPCQRSRCGTNSSAINRRACSSSRTRSSLIQAGRGRLNASIERLAFCAPQTVRLPREELLPLVLLAELTARRTLSFCRVFDVLDRIKLDVADRAVDFLHPANVDVLHNVTRVRIN